MDKYSEFLSRTPKVSPKIKLFAIYTLKRDDEHPPHFYMEVPLPGCKDHCVMYIATHI